MRYITLYWLSTVYFFISFPSLSEPFQNKLQHRKCHRRWIASPNDAFAVIGQSSATSTLTLLASQEDGPVTTVISQLDLNNEIERLCQADQVDEARNLLKESEVRMLQGDTSGPFPNEASYTKLMQAWSGRDETAVPERLGPMLEKLKRLSKEYPACTPSALTYNAVVLAWSKVARRQSGQRCDDLMYELWSQYNETGNASFLPIKATYVSTLAAWASSGRGNEGAERAEAIWEEMERLSSEHEHLGPTTICANIVLNAWSKSGARGAGQRCESILARMEALYFDGRLELKPSTTSFNTVIDALARSHEHGSEQRAEALLEHMDELSSNVGGIQPDNLSFNTVLNCWSRSRVHGAAHRAEAILRHMEQRYADGTTDIQPDAASYNTVMAAWSRTRAREASNRAQQVLQWMEDASNNGNEQAKPNAISYNIFINVLAKSNDPRASDRALETLDKMKKLADEEGREDARPDVFTYTSLLDTLAKRGSVEAAERAELVLEELETAYSETDSRSLKPNIRTYTSVVHAIARSRTAPERAERIVSRLERMYESGDGDVQPDVVCYDALINAFGWSNLKGKAQKCFDIYQKMLYLYQSRKNPDAKPDIITCNSVLNACAFDQATTESERQAIMAVAVQTLEHFQSSAPKFGRPNHITYANLLLAIEKHMPVTKEDSDSDSNHQGEHRSDLAEATFWQACQSGSVSVLVVKHLDLVLPWHRLSAILGPALLSTKGEALRFSWHKLPREWTKYAPDPKERRDSRPSRRQAAVAVTKSAMASSRRKESKS